MIPRCDEVRRDGSGFRAGHVVAGHGEIDGQDRTKAVWPGGTRMSRYGNWQTGDYVVESQRLRIVPVPTPVEAGADWAAVALQARP